jgi:type II secretory pathway pseudopilin PulG
MSMRMTLLAALVAGLALTGSATASDKAAADAAIAAAKAAQSEAAAVGGEWRDTGAMIKEAEKAASEGNFGNAVELAKKAEAQGVLGKKQAMEQVGVGNPTYLYN